VEKKVVFYVNIDGTAYIHELNLKSRIKELKDKLERKEAEINWLKEQLKKYLGSEYETKIEVNYPPRFRN
jgi:hypothetical protein